MPFTLSHPAAVLPFVRHPFSAAALVAGAVAPDLPYFARAVPVPVTAQSWYEPFMNATTSHSPVGALTVGLPYALLVTVLWWAARRPAESLLVDGDRPVLGSGRRDVAAQRAGASGVVVRGTWIVVSLVIGLATHLVWDSFTHGDGFVVTQVPALSSVVIGDVTWARLLQHVSTVVGLVLVAVYLWRRRSGLRVRSSAVVSVLAVVVTGAVVGAMLEWVRDGSGAVPVESLLRGSAEAVGVALLGATVVYVAVWRAVRWTVGNRTRVRRPA